MNRNRCRPQLPDAEVATDLTPEQIKAGVMTRFSVVSLFSGCGGMDLGFVGGFSAIGAHYARTLFSVVWANELDGAACRTYRKNIGGHIVEGDVWDALPDAPENADVVIGGFPCQDISVMARGAGVDGKRSGLYRAMVAAVARIRPKVVVVENVKGLLMRHHEGSLTRGLSDFRALGYAVSYRLYNAADYGVPQTRERVIIVGTRPDIPAFAHPAPVRGRRITAQEAIGDLEHLDTDADSSHVWSRAKKSGGRWDRKLIADRPGCTILAECHGNAPYHYSLPRRISMREAARLQSFPDDFVFDASMSATERQVGNAVPPVLAWHIATAVEKILGRPTPEQ